MPPNKKLQGEVSRLNSIRDEKKAVEQLFSMRLQLQEFKPPIVADGQAEPVPFRVASGNSHDGKGTRKMASAAPEDLHLQNMFTALIVDEELGAL